MENGNANCQERLLVVYVV